MRQLPIPPTTRLPGPAICVCLLCLPLACRSQAPPPGPPKPGPIRIAVMDPLSAPPASAGADGCARPDYGQLAAYLEARLGRAVQVAFAEDLPGLLRLNAGKLHAIVGEQPLVARAAAEADLTARPIARLTGLKGAATLTGPVPSITVFVTDALSADQQEALLEALLAVRNEAKLLKAMGSKLGFVAVEAPGGPLRAAQAATAPAAKEQGWTDWRGADRTAVVDSVPDRLPGQVKTLWRTELTGVGLSGIAATEKRVIVADKDAEKRNDIWRCLRAADGKQQWQVTYPAAGELDYGNSPRATPVIREGRVYLLGAFGDLHCVRLADGKVVWRMNMLSRFGGKRPQWGTCAAPLIVDDKLIVNPGGPEASLVALDRRTGRPVWQSPGREAAYASPIVATLGGVRQIVSYDTASLGGWDPATGKRLWELTPPVEGDFNVPTPVAVDGRLLVTSENNGTRLYAFGGDGRIKPKPVAQNDDLAPDTTTPVVMGGRVFANWDDLFCLDLAAGLRPVWQASDEAYMDYATLIGGNGRLMVFTVDGQLLLVKADGPKHVLLDRRRLYREQDAEVWSHPALVGDRLYVRNDLDVRCFLMK